MTGDAWWPTWSWTNDGALYSIANQWQQLCRAVAGAAGGVEAGGALGVEGGPAGGA